MTEQKDIEALDWTGVSPVDKLPEGYVKAPGVSRGLAKDDGESLPVSSRPVGRMRNQIAGVCSSVGFCDAHDERVSISLNPPFPSQACADWSSIGVR